MCKDCSKQSFCISTIHGGHAGVTSLWMGEGTTPWTEEVESRREQRSRVMQEQLSRVTQDDSMDGIGTSPRMGEGRTTQEQLSRVESGTETEQLPNRDRVFPRVVY